MLDQALFHLGRRKGGRDVEALAVVTIQRLQQGDVLQCLQALGDYDTASMFLDRLTTASTTVGSVPMDEALVDLHAGIGSAADPEVANDF